jgi:hypothetical protein
MGDTSMLPPVHPNCRCVPYFISEDDIPDGVTVEKPTPKETTTTTTESLPKLNTTTNEVLPDKAKVPFNDFAEKTALGNKEHKVFVSSSGEVSPIAHGERKSVKTSEAQRKWIEEQIAKGNEVYACVLEIDCTSSANSVKITATLQQWD